MGKLQGWQLHDRATRGHTLSDEERAELNAWYAQQDAEEAALLARNAAPIRAALHKQLEEARAQFLAELAHIQPFSTLTPEEQADIIAAIEQGEADFAAGRYITLDDLERKYAARLEEV